MEKKTRQIIYRVIIVVIVALIASYITRGGIEWLYSDKVNASTRMPKGYIFGIVWTVIYIAYAYAWATSIDSLISNLDLIFTGAILLNLAWVVVFFGLRNIELAKIIIVLLALVTGFQAFQQWRAKNTLNTFLLLVYLSWLICAAGLNFDTTLAAR
jgi:tryptophan-rich sensory protein